MVRLSMMGDKYAMAERAVIFDRRAVRRHRDRAAADFANHDFLVAEVADRVADRLNDIDRRFPRVLDLGCHTGLLRARLNGQHGITHIVQCDLSEAMVGCAYGVRLVVDEERLPFRSAAFDLVLSVLNLHWVNDLPGTLIQIRRCLKPDGLMIAALLGGDSLADLRAAFIDADATLGAGVPPRIAPFATVQTLGMLLQRAGFALPVVDSDSISASYPDALAVMRDLRGMGQANALVDRPRRFARRDAMLGAAGLYQSRHSDRSGRVPVTFEIITLTGWAPHPSQPQALQPGTATARLTDALAKDPPTRAPRDSPTEGGA